LSANIAHMGIIARFKFTNSFKLLNHFWVIGAGDFVPLLFFTRPAFIQLS